MTTFADAISQIESGGNYGILGPTTKGGDRAYGKYQIMGNNIPQWTKEVLGAPMSPQEFLHNPQAQDAVFEGKFGQYVQKYGPEGAARAWFAGPGGMNNPKASDGHTTVAQYAQQFNSLMAPQLPPATNIGAAPATPEQVPSLAGPMAPQQPQQQEQQPQAAGAPYEANPFLQQLMKPQQQQPQIQFPQPLRPYFNMARSYQRIPLPAGFNGFQT